MQTLMKCRILCGISSASSLLAIVTAYGFPVNGEKHRKWQESHFTHSFQELAPITKNGPVHEVLVFVAYARQRILILGWTRTGSSEPSLPIHAKMEYRCRFVQRFGPIYPLDSWVCIIQEWFYAYAMSTKSWCTGSNKTLNRRNLLCLLCIHVASRGRFVGL